MTLVTPIHSGSDLRRPRVMLAGEFSTGKTRLLNGLIGQQLLPSSVISTALPAMWLSSGAPQFQIHYFDKRAESFETVDALLERLQSTQLRSVARCDLRLPTEKLLDFDLIDTPGTSDPNMDQEAWVRLLSSADIVVWCTNIVQAWRQSEKSAWAEVPPAIAARSILLLTHADLVTDPGARARIMARVEREAGGAFGTVLAAALGNAEDVEQVRKALLASAATLGDLSATLGESPMELPPPPQPTLTVASQSSSVPHQGMEAQEFQDAPLPILFPRRVRPRSAMTEPAASDAAHRLERAAPSPETGQILHAAFRSSTQIETEQRDFSPAPLSGDDGTGIGQVDELPSALPIQPRIWLSADTHLDQAAEQDLPAEAPTDLDIGGAELVSEMDVPTLVEDDDPISQTDGYEIDFLPATPDEEDGSEGQSDSAVAPEPAAFDGDASQQAMPEAVSPSFDAAETDANVRELLASQFSVTALEQDAQADGVTTETVATAGAAEPLERLDQLSTEAELATLPLEPPEGASVAKDIEEAEPEQDHALIRFDFGPARLVWSEIAGEADLETLEGTLAAVEALISRVDRDFALSVMMRYPELRPAASSSRLAVMRRRKEISTTEDGISK